MSRHVLSTESMFSGKYTLRKGGEPDPAYCSVDAVTAGTLVHSYKPH